MNSVSVNLWNRDFNLPAIYSCYPGEEVTELQINALKMFCEDKDTVQNMLEDLKQYVAETSEEIAASSEIENIFKYVMPKRLFIPRSKEMQVAIICNYKFDMENGIAIVFENGSLLKIGTQDIIL